MSFCLFIPSPLLVPSEDCHSLSALHSILKESGSQFGQDEGLHLTVGEAEEDAHHGAFIIDTAQNPRGGQTSLLEENLRKLKSLMLRFD